MPIPSPIFAARDSDDELLVSSWLVAAGVGKVGLFTPVPPGMTSVDVPVDAVDDVLLSVSMLMLM